MGTNKVLFFPFVRANDSCSDLATQFRSVLTVCFLFAQHLSVQSRTQLATILCGNVFRAQYNALSLSRFQYKIIQAHFMKTHDCPCLYSLAVEKWSTRRAWRMITCFFFFFATILFFTTANILWAAASVQLLSHCTAFCYSTHEWHLLLCTVLVRDNGWQQFTGRLCFLGAVVVHELALVRALRPVACSHSHTLCIMLGNNNYHLADERVDIVSLHDRGGDDCESAQWWWSPYWNWLCLSHDCVDAGLLTGFLQLSPQSAKYCLLPFVF